MENLIALGQKAKEASAWLGSLSSTDKNTALGNVRTELLLCKDAILAANAKDMAVGKRSGMPAAMLDRLMLDERRIMAMADSLSQIAALDDPIGEVFSMQKRPNGLLIGQQRVPLGVVCIIYEARPGVTLDAAAICLKTGNAAILKGGKEALESNKAIAMAINQALKKTGFTEGCVQLVTDTNREASLELMKMNKYIDLLIPRGGRGLIETVLQNSRIPVIETGSGNCHVYVDSSADLDMAKSIIINAKTSRPGVCNAMEKLLVNTGIAKDFLPGLLDELSAMGVEVRADPFVCSIYKNAKQATAEDWAEEYLDLVLAVKVVNDVDEAIKHINQYGTKHSEAIVSDSYENTRKFLERVDAAAVYANASTRFTDGFEFGYGAELGISTQKLHARGPMGLKALTSIKYVIYGSGQIR